MIDVVTILGYVLVPITSVITWMATRKKQRNDFLKELQSSIDVLAAENKTLYKELLDLRRDLYERDKEILELKKQLLKKNENAK